jgi:hypothetical protein
MPINVPIADITLDPRLQMRETMDFAVIDEYAENIDKLPPCKTIRDGESIWLTSGWHRYHATKKAGRSELPCTVREGTFLDALVEACGENEGHGIRRTSADKRRAVAALLGIEEWARKSDRLIADACKVGHHLVADVRASISTGRAPSRPASSRRTSADGRSRPATQPPRESAKPEPSHEPDAPLLKCRTCRMRAEGPKPGCRNCVAANSPKSSEPTPKPPKPSEPTPAPVLRPPAAPGTVVCPVCGQETSDTACQDAVPIPPELDTPEFIAAWDEWAAFRRRKKAKLTTVSTKLQLEDLAPLGVAKAIECLRSSMKNGWTGIFPEKFAKEKNGKTDDQGRRKAIAAGWYRPSLGVPFDPAIHNEENYSKANGAAK